MSQDDDSKQARASSTTQWFFTFWPEESFSHPEAGELLYTILSQHCKAFGFQWERGADGRPHYQGEVQFLNKTRKPSGLIRDLGGDLVFQWIHWEPTRNPGGARVYCGKADGRIDGPWRFGQNKGAEKVNGWRLAMDADTLQEAEGYIKQYCPRDWLSNGDRIRENLRREHKVSHAEFKSFPPESFKNVPAGAREFFDRYVGAGKRDALGIRRYPLLILCGATQLGKTEWVRSMGKHIYWKGLLKLDDLKRSDYDFIVIDDVEWEHVHASVRKSVLLGTGDCIVTDRYVKKLAVCADKPCVFLCNPPEGAARFNSFWRDAYWVPNVVFIEIKERLF